MTSNPKWKKLINYSDDDIQSFVDVTTFRHIVRDDKCFYLMEWIKKGGYHSKANSLILNFKNLPKATRQNPRYHKDNAIKQFAKDLFFPLEQIIEKYSGKSIFCFFIPSSTSQNDTNYDDRFERVCNHLKNKFQDKIHFKQPIKVKNSRERSSKSEEFRGDSYVKSIKESFSWEGLHTTPDVIVIFDDVITAGSQFRACKELILEKTQNNSLIIGLFWSKAIQKSTND